MTLFDELFSYEALQRVLSDESGVQSMLNCEAALARAEARTGVIPEIDARKITEKCRAQHFDLPAIRKEAARAGNAAIPVIKMLTELVAKGDTNAARFVHWGATSQDVIDTGCVLQLRRAFELMDQDVSRLSATLAALAEKYRETPVVARTWMQHALPTTFGFIGAGWTRCCAIPSGWPKFAPAPCRCNLAEQSARWPLWREDDQRSPKRWRKNSNCLCPW